MRLITPDVARDLQKLSVEARKIAQREAEFAKARALIETKENPQVVRVAKQIAAIEEMMDGEKDSKELVNLSAAHARLFSAWCVLTGTKSPGTMGKSRRERPSAPQPIPAPLDNPMSNPPAPPANEDWKRFTG